MSMRSFTVKSLAVLALAPKCRPPVSLRRMRHLIAILLQNEAGALTRVTGLISTRGYNIESLSVAPTNDPTVSRVTLVTIGSDPVIAQINAQLLKLVDVVAVEDMTSGDHLARELLLIKLQICGRARRGGGGLAAPRRRQGAVVQSVELHRRAHQHRDRNRRVHRQRRRRSARSSKSCAAACSASRARIRACTPSNERRRRGYLKSMTEIEVTPEHAADPKTRIVSESWSAWSAYFSRWSPSRRIARTPRRSSSAPAPTTTGPSIRRRRSART